MIVGMDLRIRRHTQSAEKRLDPVAGDAGRSFSQLDAFVVDRRVENLAARVIDNLAPVDERLLCADQRLYNLRITLYRALDHSIRGTLVVLTEAEDGARSDAKVGATGRRKRATGEKI